MPQITSIKQQKKLTERFSIFVDGVFTLGVDGSLVVKYDLRVGTEFTETLQRELENADRIELAYTGLLNFIAFRERCEYEVHEWLYRKGFQDLETELIDRLKSRNYLDDARFTRLFVRDRVKLKGWGPTRLRHELAKKRIERGLIEQALSEIADEYDFAEIAADIAQRKLKHIEHPSYRDKNRIFNLLQRRGFAVPVILTALENIEFHSEESDGDSAIGPA